MLTYRFSILAVIVLLVKQKTGIIKLKCATFIVNLSLMQEYFA